MVAYDSTLRVYEASLVAQTVERLPATRETQVQSLGWEDPLEKEMATHSSVLAWRIPGTVGPGELPPMESHCCSHMFRETNLLRRTMQIVECSFLHQWAQGRVSS